MESSSICDQFSDKLDNFREWINNQAELPKNMKNLLLLRYLKVCDFDQEKARKLLLHNLETRDQNPYLFTDRDIMSEKLQKAMHTVQVCPLPLYTKHNHKVTVFRLTDDNPNNYDVVNTFKMFFMMSDVRYITPDTVGLTEGEIGVMDFQGFSFRHFFKVATNLSALRTYLKYVQEAVPFRIHQNHFVNCSPTLTRIIALIRPFVKKEVFDVMHFHTAGYESLHEHVPREILPTIYGGEVGDINDIFKEWKKVTESHRAYLNDELNWQLSSPNSS